MLNRNFKKERFACEIRNPESAFKEILPKKRNGNKNNNTQYYN